MWKNKFGFTLIELLVTMGVLAALSAGVIALIGQGPAQSSRDVRRKTDLEKTASGLELYRNDNAGYPQCPGAVADCFITEMTNGAGMPVVSTYIPQLPEDPKTPARRYRYAPFDSGGGTCDGTGSDRCVRYILCTALEKGTGSVSGCGLCGTTTCNFLIASP